MAKSIIKLPKLHSLKAWSYCSSKYHEGHNESSQTPMTSDGYFITKEQADIVLDALKELRVSAISLGQLNREAMADKSIAIFTDPVCCPEKYATVQGK